MDFEWDFDKAIENEEKHGVSFEEAASVLTAVLAITVLDQTSEGEERFVTIGHSDASRVLLVVHCERGEDTIRIISARAATKKEKKFYEKGI